jgi:hypothetical protein
MKPAGDIRLTGLSSCNFEDVTAETSKVSYQQKEPFKLLKKPFCDRLQTAEAV